MLSIYRAAVMGVLLAISGQAFAASGECLLEVKGRAYIDGACDIRLETGGSFTISHGQYFAMVLIDTDQGEAMGHWNEQPGARHAHSRLGTLARRGACWVNRDAKVCAWKTGTRRAYDR